MEKEKEKEVMSKDSGPGLSEDLNHDGFYFPSVDLLTAQVQNPEFPKNMLRSAFLHFSFLLLHVCKINNGSTSTTDQQNNVLVSCF